jgi:hypothetical protein
MLNLSPLPNDTLSKNITDTTGGRAHTLASERHPGFPSGAMGDQVYGTSAPGSCILSTDAACPCPSTAQASLAKDTALAPILCGATSLNTAPVLHNVGPLPSEALTGKHFYK